MSKKEVIELGDLRIEKLKEEGIVIKDKFTRAKQLEIPSLKKLGFRRV